MMLSALGVLYATAAAVDKGPLCPCFGHKALGYTHLSLEYQNGNDYVAIGNLRRNVKGNIVLRLVKLAKEGKLDEVLDALNGRIRASHVVYAALLRACADAGAVSDAKRVHSHLIRDGLKEEMFIGNVLVETYAKCGNFIDARAVFNKMPQKDVYVWTSMMEAYVQYGHEVEVIGLFRQMMFENVEADKVAFTTVLKACATPATLTHGKQIHLLIIKRGFESDVFVGTALLNMYSKAGCLYDAKTTFSRILQRNVVSWNAIIGAYAQQGHCKDVIELYSGMQSEGIRPDRITVLSILRTCSSIDLRLEEGRIVHSCIIGTRCQLDDDVCTKLIIMYCKFPSICDAKRMFDSTQNQNLTCWNAMIMTYNQCGMAKKSLKMFQEMKKQCKQPDKVTFSTVLSACGTIVALAEGRLIHAAMISGQLSSDVAIENSLINFYGKCGCLDDACKIFDKMFERNVISWTSIIAAYASNHCNDVLQLFIQMQKEDVKPDAISLHGLTNVAILSRDRLIHTESYFDSNALKSLLVKSYGKCGRLSDALRIFDKMDNVDMITWTSIIGAHAQHGCSTEALQFFQKMQKYGVRPDDITLVEVLSACSHSGLVDEGCLYFVSLSHEHGIKPTTEHYGCMIDLFGRIGQLSLANELLNNMPFHPDIIAWRALLSACRIYGDIERAQCAAERILELDPTSDSVCILLSNVYAAEGKWNEAWKLRKIIAERGMKKACGLSTITVGSKVHKFSIHDKKHPWSEELYSGFERMALEMKAAP